MFYREEACLILFSEEAIPKGFPLITSAIPLTLLNLKGLIQLFKCTIYKGLRNQEHTYLFKIIHYGLK